MLALPASAPALTPAPAHLLIYAQEWSLWPSRSSLPAGPVQVELDNRGQDAHDVAVRRLAGRGTMVGPVLARVAPTPSGVLRHAVWHLRAGRYELVCTMPGHMAAGMHADIRVTGR